MRRLVVLMKDAFQSVLGLLGAKRDAYDGAKRFAVMRLRVFVALAANILLVGAVLAVVGGRTFEIEIWYQPAFPANLLVVRNEGVPIDSVVLMLDGGYRVDDVALVPGVNGFEIEPQFRDEKGERPPIGYRPKRVVVMAEGRAMEVVVESRER